MVQRRSLHHWLVNGMPERFPGMPVIWMDSGISWVPWLMMRIDNEYRMRSSVMPLAEAAAERVHASDVLQLQPGRGIPPGRTCWPAAYRAIDAPTA